jgi:hypothetical protein
MWPSSTQSLATYFSVSDEEIRKSGDTVEDSVELANGGYLAALGIYHELHCLVRLSLLETASLLSASELAFREDFDCLCTKRSTTHI